jgi:hypothetical protein
MFTGGLMNFIWYCLVIYFVVIVIWMFIAIFADIFRRRDIGGWAKVGWILLIFIVPFIGIIIYVATRPMTADNV